MSERRCLIRKISDTENIISTLLMTRNKEEQEKYTEHAAQYQILTSLLKTKQHQIINLRKELEDGVDASPSKSDKQVFETK